MSDITVCPKCGGLQGETFAGTPCSCTVGDSNRSYEPYSSSALKSEVERLKVELEKVNRFRESLRSKFNRKSDQLSEALHHLESVKRQHDEAQAAAAVMRSALEKSKAVHRKQFVGPIDAGFIEHQDAFEACRSALDTTAGTTFLARVAEAEWLLDNVIEHAAFIADPSAQSWMNRRDAFLKSEGVKA